MEAADDISYCLSDIEDGIEKGYTTHEQFYRFVREDLEERNVVVGFFDRVLGDARSNRGAIEQTVYVRTQLVRMLVDVAASSYVEQHASILGGSASPILDDKSGEPYQLLKSIRTAVRKHLYARKASVELELAGCAAIQGILKRLESLIRLQRDEFTSLASGNGGKSLCEEERLFSLLPPKYVKAYLAASVDQGDDRELILRQHLLVDFVAGMTDIFALRTYQMLIGLR